MSGSTFLSVGYVCGRDDDFGFGMAVGGRGVYFTGHTLSTEGEGFPVVIGPDLTHNGAEDAFVALVAKLGAPIYLGHLGGTDLDQGLGVAIDVFENLYVAGHTASSELTFPVKQSPDVTFNGDALFGVGDAFVTKV